MGWAAQRAAYKMDSLAFEATNAIATLLYPTVAGSGKNNAIFKLSEISMWR